MHTTANCYWMTWTFLGFIFQLLIFLVPEIAHVMCVVVKCVFKLWIESSLFFNCWYSWNCSCQMRCQVSEWINSLSHNNNSYEGQICCFCHRTNLSNSSFVYNRTGCDHLRDVFGHMGLSDQDIVALSGGHTLVIFWCALTYDLSHKFFYTCSFTALCSS